MQVDQILTIFNRHRADYLLIGGMHFLIRHKPILTFDIDLWIDGQNTNVQRCEAALAELDAAWGPTDAEWEPVRNKAAGWLSRQSMYSLTSPYGAIDIFLSVTGLGPWPEARLRAISCRTAAGATYFGLSDEDMLACQLALPAQEQKNERIQTLKAAIAIRNSP